MGPYLGMPIYIPVYIYIYIYISYKETTTCKVPSPFRHEASLPSKMLALVQIIITIYSLHATNISDSY